MVPYLEINTGQKINQREEWTFAKDCGNVVIRIIKLSFVEDICNMS